MREFDDKFIAEVERGLTKLVIERLDKIAIQTHNRLVQRTPVDSGQARAGWNFTLGYRNLAFRAKPANGGTLPPPRSKPNMRAKAVGDVYHLTNAVPHIVYLNEGSSDKAPANFVEIETQQAVKDVGR